MYFKSVFLSMLIFCVTTLTEAKTFTSQFTEFELPNGWECALEGSEWVCQSENKDRKKEAIIILAAKFRGEQDSLDQYQAYLKESKSFQLPGGKSQVSEPKSISVRKINNQQWVDALHLASEVPGFYTRYLATVKDNLGIAVTFSVAKDHYNTYQDIFEKIIATLKVFDQKSAGNFELKNKTAEDVEVGGDIIDADSPKVDISQQKRNDSSGFGGENGSMILIIVAVVGILIFLRMKKKKK
ncbi:MAG: hypothetical protein L6Q33_12795 [Bacteriovoracaceae bacterium]|jgi:hypothetical protein|nr:hypothetical protein [Bacteriovoracaceae bacterium]